MYDTDSRPGLDGTAVMRKPPSIRTLSWTILLLLLFGLGMCVAEHHAPPVPPSSTVTITTGNPAGPTGAPKVRVFYESPTSYGAPDLVYNCAVMPNICANINILYPLNANMGIDTSKSPTGEWWIPLHWDADTTAKHKRRKARCGKFDAKQCPNANTLPVTGRGIVDADGSTAYVDKKGKGQDGAVKGGLIDLGKAPKGVPDLAYITNEKKELLGMIWSCEEWPPASTIEGDRWDYAVDCAPMNAACAIPGNKVSHFPDKFIRSEQNFQGAAQARLAQVVRAKGDKDKKKAWRYNQLTSWETPKRRNWGASVKWGDAVGKFIEDEYPKFDKRDLEILARENITDEPHVYHIEEHFYLNGSSAKTHRLHRRGEANQLDHILTYTGRLEWSRQISPEDDRPVYRDDENTDSPSESAPQSINDCTNEWLKDPKDMKPGQIDIDDEDTDPNCNYC